MNILKVFFFRCYVNCPICSPLQRISLIIVEVSVVLFRFELSQKFKNSSDAFFGLNRSILATHVGLDPSGMNGHDADAERCLWQGCNVQSFEITIVETEKSIFLFSKLLQNFLSKVLVLSKYNCDVSYGVKKMPIHVFLFKITKN